MKTKRASSTRLFILACLALTVSFSVVDAASLSSRTLKSDLAYYRKLSRDQNLNLNDRYYVLMRLEEKYQGSGVNLAPLRDEMALVKKGGAAAVAAAAAAPAENPVARSGAVRKLLVSESKGHSQVIVTADGVQRFNYFTLRDPEPGKPPKIVLDFYGVTIALSDAARDIRPGAGLFSDVHSEQLENEPDRIVRVTAEMRSDRPYRVLTEGNRWIVSVEKEATANAAVTAAAVVPSAPEKAVAVPIPVEVPEITASSSPAIEPAEAPAPKPAPPRTKPESMQNYSIESGDVLGITVYPADELSRETVVQADGKIPFPLLGTAQARGLSPARLETSLEKGLEKYISNPQVTVTVKQFSRRQVFITGEVRSVGAYNYKENLRLLEFVSSVGGFTDTANRKEVKIYRGPSTRRRTYTVNVEDIIRSGDFSKDFLLEPGDIVEVSKGQDRIAILGDVRSPGYYDYRENLKLLELISLAGGFTDMAEIRKVNIIHPAEKEKTQSTTRVDLKKILSGQEKDVSVASGDTVYVPKKSIAGANWFVNNILPWASLISLVLVIRGGI